MSFSILKKLASYSFLFALVLSAISNTQLSAQKIYALSGNNLISFNANTVSSVASLGPITGITSGQTLVGIDFRPQTGELYGIGYRANNGEARLYTINTTTAVATPIGAAAFTLVPNMGNITFDFNPTVDRIRLMGSNNANYRLHPVTGAIAATDGMLSYAAADVNAAQVSSIGTGAYANSYIASTSTSLYNYDTKLNVLTLQNPPNNGIQNTIGSSGIIVNPADPSVSLDGYFDAASNTNMFFLAANTGTSTNDDLYMVDVATGKATLRGSIGMEVRDIAVQIVRNVPAQVGDLVYGLTTNNVLVSFDAQNPGIIRNAVPVTGLATGEVLSGMDFRPASGELYGLGYNATTGEARLYTIKISTGVATAVSTTPIALAPNLGKIGFDFNPLVDRIRVTSSSNANYRLHPVTGALAATDLSLAFNALDVNRSSNPSIGASAYSNSFAGTTATTLYNYDDSLNVLTTQVPPNDGKLNTVGASGITVNLIDPTTDLDIYYDAATATNRAYLIANTGTSVSDDLYNINLTTGAATKVGKVGNGSALVDITAFVAADVALVCPANITVTPGQGSSTAVATYALPNAASGCETGLNTLNITSGLSSGSAFPGGVNTVCYMASDLCNNTGTCCFTVTVTETPCDTKTVGCMKYELLAFRTEANGKRVVRIRVTNSCSSALDYAAFQLPNGTTAFIPANNATFTAASNNNYTVRNPNFQPFYSVRFKAQTTGIKDGQSDVFQYTLPAGGNSNYIHVATRTVDGTAYDAYLNNAKCLPILLPNGNAGPTELIDSESAVVERGTTGTWSIYPNPSNGQLMIDLSAYAGSWAKVAIHDANGTLMARQTIEQVNEGNYDFSDLTTTWSNGVYFIETLAANGDRKMMRWTLMRK